MNRIIKYLTIAGMVLLITGCHKTETDKDTQNIVSNQPAVTQGVEGEEKQKQNLQKSYKEFDYSDALQQVAMEMEGYEITIPQFVGMDNVEKENKLNEIIQNQVKKNIKETGISKEGDFPFHLNSYKGTIKRLDQNMLSILVEADGMGESAAHPFAWAYAINIDLQEERALSNDEILPAKYYEKVEKLIMQKCCTDIKNIGYRKLCKKINNGKLFSTKEAWKVADFYYSSKDGIGVVIPTIYATGSYQIYEVDGSYLDFMKEKAVSISNPYFPYGEQQEISMKLLIEITMDAETSLYLKKKDSSEKGMLYSMKFQKVKNIKNYEYIYDNAKDAIKDFQYLLEWGDLWVTKDKIYYLSFDLTVKEKEKLLEKGRVPEDAMLVCQEETTKDSIKDGKIGTHFWIEKHGENIRCFRQYNINQKDGEARSIFQFVWKKNVGLVGCRFLGHAPGGNSIIAWQEKYLKQQDTGFTIDQ